MPISGQKFYNIYTPKDLSPGIGAGPGWTHAGLRA